MGKVFGQPYLESCRQLNDTKGTHCCGGGSSSSYPHRRLILEMREREGSFTQFWKEGRGWPGRGDRVNHPLLLCDMVRHFISPKLTHMIFWDLFRGLGRCQVVGIEWQRCGTLVAIYRLHLLDNFRPRYGSLFSYSNIPDSTATGLHPTLNTPPAFESQITSINRRPKLRKPLDMHLPSRPIKQNTLPGQERHVPHHARVHTLLSEIIVLGLAGLDTPKSFHDAVFGPRQV